DGLRTQIQEPPWLLSKSGRTVPTDSRAMTTSRLSTGTVTPTRFPPSDRLCCAGVGDRLRSRFAIAATRETGLWHQKRQQMGKWGDGEDGEMEWPLSHLPFLDFPIS